MNFYALQVKKVIQETSDAVSIVFSIPNDLSDTFTFLPGQYVTVKSQIKDQEVRRPYSINSLPGSPELSITVKMVDKGTMSHYLCQCTAGTTLEVSSPEGHFTLAPTHEKTRAHYFFAAGSGITPVMSMIQSVMEEEPKSSCFLLYGNRNEDNIIFKESLEKCSQKYAGQLFIDHTLSQPHASKVKGFSGWLGKKETSWSGMKGRISEQTISLFLENHPSKFEEKHYYLCGPGDMIQVAEKYLSGKGVEPKKIHREFFTTPTKDASGAQLTQRSGASTIYVTLNGQEHVLEIAPNALILEALIEKKLDPPYSCTNGACSTCVAKVTEGEVKMDVCYALEQDEIDAGFVLTCQSRAVTDKVVLTYDV